MQEFLSVVPKHPVWNDLTDVDVPKNVLGEPLCDIEAVAKAYVM